MHLFAFSVRASTVPALPEDFHMAHLLKTDIQLETEVTPRSDTSIRKLSAKYIKMPT